MHLTRSLPTCSSAARAPRCPGARAPQTWGCSEQQQQQQQLQQQQQRSRRCRTAALAPPAAGTGVWPRPLQSAQAGDLLACRGPDQLLQHLEVVAGWDAASSSCQVLWRGKRLSLTAHQDGSLGLADETTGAPSLVTDSATLACYPQLTAVLPAMLSQAGTKPTITAAEVVTSLDQLVAEVQQAPAFWCDGSPPGGPLKTDLQLSLFTAGELAALMAGQRGVVVVQLFNGWDRDKGQPLLDSPFAVCMLERALAAPGINAAASVAPGGAGLTAVLYADREPFAAWAHHLASFGCQANIVAGSSYYKLLVGLLLGYKPANVLGYVAASGEPASQQLQRQVSADIRQLSKVKPKLPWSINDTSIRKSKTPGLRRDA